MLHHSGELALLDRHGEEGQAIGARRSEREQDDELGEQGCFARREFELFPQLAAERGVDGLAGLDAAAEKAPMVGKHDPEVVVAQLHQIALIGRDQDGAGGPAGDLGRNAHRRWVSS